MMIIVNIFPLNIIRTGEVIMSLLKKKKKYRLVWLDIMTVIGSDPELQFLIKK
jgi:hypothetical protein